jgi:hypothetical protein
MVPLRSASLARLKSVFSVQEAWLSALGVIHGDGVHWLSWFLLCCLYSQQSDFDQRRHDLSNPFQLPRARSTFNVNLFNLSSKKFHRLGLTLFWDKW